MLISLADEAILWPEELINGLPLHRIFYHAVHGATPPIEVKALANYYVVVIFELGKERLRNGPSRLGPCRFKYIEGTARLSSQSKSVLGKKTHGFLLHRLCLINELGKG